MTHQKADDYAALRTQLEQAQAEVGRLRTHQKGIVQGATPLEIAERILAEHEDNIPRGASRQKLDDELCRMCALASTIKESVARETALREALAKGVPCVKIPALTKDGEDFAAQYIAIDPKYWNEEADRMVVRFPDMPYREWRALSGEGSNQ
jgi:hypothetical protein